VPVDALTATDASYTNIDVAIVAKGNGATLAQVPDASTTGGNKRGTYATDLQKQRSGATQVASGNNSVVCGGSNNTASSAHSAVAGGQTNAASNTFTFIGSGSSNTASGSYSIIGGGASNTASATYSGIGSGLSNTSSQNYGYICGGQSNTVSGALAFIGGGANNTASGEYSFIGGGRYGTTRAITGYHVFPACNIPFGGVLGAAQSAILLLAVTTTNATPTVATSDNVGAGATNQIVLPNNSAYSFSGQVIAGVTGAGNTARWTIAGAIKRGASAATTVMVGTPTVTMTHNDAGASAWTVAVTANTTLGCIKVEVTGAASTTIRWVCKIETTEMTF
jgi:hypothetical protein